MRYSFFLITFLVLVTFQTKAQNYFWVAFTDKNNTEYSLSNPEEYLSQRAIERRIKQNISIDSLDLPVNKNYIDSILSINVEFVHASKWLNGVTVKTNLDSLENTILAWSFVKEVQLTKSGTATKSAVNKFQEPGDESVPIDTSYYGASVHQLGMLNGQFLHNENIKGQGMHIAVIDAGFIDADKLPAFDSLWQNNQILGTKDILNKSTSIFDTPGDYHGMSVLSCMGGNIPGQLIGTAPLASYWLIRSEDVLSEYIIEEDNWAVAAEFADSAGVDVINSSLGYYAFDDTNTNHIYADMDGKTTRVTQAANIAASRGILVVTSAGNEGNKSWQRIIAPSDGDLVIGVGAVDKDLNPASFTSRGPASDGDIKPNVSAMGYRTTLQLSSGNIGLASGTSFSSPVMAGMAASLWQKYPQKTALEIKSAIEMSGHIYNSPNSLLGYGVPDMEIASEILDPVFVSKLEINKNWKVYPNPVNDYIVIQYKGNDIQNKIKIELYSLSGQLIQKWNKPLSRSIVLNDIPKAINGMFLLRISNSNYSETIKLSKAK